MYSPRLYFKDLWVLVPLGVSVLCQIFMWWVVVHSHHPSGEQFFLHYTIVFGVDWYGEWWKTIYMPAVGVGVLLVNLIISFFFYRDDKVIARLLMVTTLVFHLFLVASIYFILGLNS